MERLSSHRSRANEVRPWLSLRAYSRWRLLAARTDRELVAKLHAGEAGDNSRASNTGGTLLLAVAGGKPSNASAFREHAAENCETVVAEQDTQLAESQQISVTNRKQRNKSLTTQSKNSGFNVH